MAERNYKRFEALHADNAASELELDMAKMQYEQARGASRTGRRRGERGRVISG